MKVMSEIGSPISEVELSQTFHQIASEMTNLNTNLIVRKRFTIHEKKKSFMLLRIFFFLLTIIISLSSFACTSFFINKDGKMIFGRNYDWISDEGLLFTNIRGSMKTSMNTNDGKTISWVSKYGSVSFNQYGKEFPTGGMNEKGLVVELMWLEGTQYPSADQRPAVSTLQWIQYQLDCSANVDEIIASDKLVRIATKGTVPLHFLVADAQGDAATIEFLDGKMVVHTGKELPFPVLANDTYESSLQYSTSSLVSASYSSLDRFGRACRMLDKYHAGKIEKPVVDYAFDILENVAQGDWTKWSIVYDIRNKKIYYKSLRASTVKNVSLNAFGFSCKDSPQMLNINQDLAGNVSGSFLKFSIEGYKSILETAIRESQSRVMISDKSKDALLYYAKQVMCD